VAYIRMAMPSCFWLLRHEVWRAFSRAREKTGNRIAARIAMIAITTSSSISVKPLRNDGECDESCASDLLEMCV